MAKPELIRPYASAGQERRRARQQTSSHLAFTHLLHEGLADGDTQGSGGWGSRLGFLEGQDLTQEES